MATEDADIVKDGSGGNEIDVDRLIKATCNSNRQLRHLAAMKPQQTEEVGVGIVVFKQRQSCLVDGHSGYSITIVFQP